VFSNVGETESREGRISFIGRGSGCVLEFRAVVTKLRISQKRGEESASNEQADWRCPCLN